MFETLILTVALLGNGDLEVIEQPKSNTTFAVYCSGGCNFPPPGKVKKIYRAKDGKIELFKEVHQVAVEKTKTEFVMEFPE